MTDPTLRVLMGIVGSGPNSADDMNRTQARAAMRRVLDGGADPTTFGAFLLANRWKRNTPEELAAFLDVMREESVRAAEPTVDPVDCGANYDGKTETALLGVAAGIVAAAAGTPVVVHSGDRVPVQEAVAYRHVLDELGIATSLTPAESARMVDATGFGFYDQLQFNPAVHALLPRRRAMAVRTVLNTVETLANPAEATVHLGSFFHLSFARKLAHTIAESQTLPVERAVFFKGLEGYDDVRPGRTKLAVWSSGELAESAFRPAEIGVEFSTDDLAVDTVAGDSAAITEAVLTGDRSGSVADAIALNAALRIFAPGDASSIADGLEVARKTIADGEAAAILDALRTFEPVRVQPA